MFPVEKGRFSAVVSGVTGPTGCSSYLCMSQELRAGGGHVFNWKIALS